jgi:hypothetical protein
MKIKKNRTSKIKFQIYPHNLLKMLAYFRFSDLSKNK